MKLDKNKIKQLVQKECEIEFLDESYPVVKSFHDFAHDQFINFITKVVDKIITNYAVITGNQVEIDNLNPAEKIEVEEAVNDLSVKDSLEKSSQIDTSLVKDSEEENPLVDISSEEFLSVETSNSQKELNIDENTTWDNIEACIESEENIEIKENIKAEKSIESSEENNESSQDSNKEISKETNISDTDRRKSNTEAVISAPPEKTKDLTNEYEVEGKKLSKLLSSILDSKEIEEVNSNHDLEETNPEETSDETLNNDINEQKTKITDEEWEKQDLLISEENLISDARWDLKPAIDDSSKENITDENTTEESIDNINDSDDELSPEEKQKIKKMEEEYRRKEFPSLSFPEFVEQDSFINQNIEYKSTPMMHDFISAVEEKDEYDKYDEPHHAYISDFFPIDNEGVYGLLKTVRQTIKQYKELIKDTTDNVYIDIPSDNVSLETISSVDLYKYWILYLKQFTNDYHIYDLRNYTDNGDYLGRKDLEFNDTCLDDYVSKVTGSTVMYDELKEKQEREKIAQKEAEELILSGKYVSDIDPDFGKEHRGTNKTSETTSEENKQETAGSPPAKEDNWDNIKSDESKDEFESFDNDGEDRSIEAYKKQKEDEYNSENEDDDEFKSLDEIKHKDSKADKNELLEQQDPFEIDKAELLKNDSNSDLNSDLNSDSNDGFDNLSNEHLNTAVEKSENEVEEPHEFKTTSEDAFKDAFKDTSENVSKNVDMNEKTPFEKIDSVAKELEKETVISQDEFKSKAEDKSLNDFKNDSKDESEDNLKDTTENTSKDILEDVTKDVDTNEKTPLEEINQAAENSEDIIKKSVNEFIEKTDIESTDEFKNKSSENELFENELIDESKDVNGREERTSKDFHKQTDSDNNSQTNIKESDDMDDEFKPVPSKVLQYNIDDEEFLPPKKLI